MYRLVVDFVLVCLSFWILTSLCVLVFDMFGYGEN